MLVIGRSGAQSDWPHVPFPPLEGFGAARMHVAGLQVLVQPLSDRSVRCCYCCNIDLRAPLPRPLVHLATQHVVGRIFHALQQEARKIRRGAAHSAHAARIERDAHVYFEWMLPRVDAALDLAALRTALRSSASTSALGATTRQPSFCFAAAGSRSRPYAV